MEIKINKEKQAQLQQAEVKKVLREAQIIADHGKKSFFHERELDNGLLSWQLINMIEKETNGTVYGAVKSMGLIKFSIKD